MRIFLNVNKSLWNYRFIPNEAGLYTKCKNFPTRILFEYFDGTNGETYVRIFKRMKRFIIRMKLYDQYLVVYDRKIVENIFNEK